MKRLLRTWLWMLALSLVIGLSLGTCVRRQVEQPARYIGALEPDAPSIRSAISP